MCCIHLFHPILKIDLKVLGNYMRYVNFVSISSTLSFNE